jgi:hypothetical protein
MTNEGDLMMGHETYGMDGVDGWRKPGIAMCCCINSGS